MLRRFETLPSGLMYTIVKQREQKKNHPSDERITIARITATITST
jgi:hypothetical protein